MTPLAISDSSVTAAHARSHGRSRFLLPAPALSAHLLTPAGPAARRIDDLWEFMLVLGVVVFVLVCVLLALGLIRKERAPDPTRPDRTRLWLLGSVGLSAVIVVAVLLATLATMRDTPEESPDADVTVEVVGHQWWWEVTYPDQEVVTANEIHVPAGARVLLRLSSADVVHSFWVPDLAGKKDLIPEATTSLMIEADEPGTYRGQCAEFCGLQHANMGVYVLASTADEFDAWVDDQQRDAAEPTSEQERRGAEVFADAGCGDCHTIRGTDADGTRGPDLTHVAGRRTLAAGTIRNTTENLAAWITDPHVYKEGVAMEPTPLDDGALDALVAYLEALE